MIEDDPDIEYCEVCDIYLLIEDEFESGICDDCYKKFFQEADYVN